MAILTSGWIGLAFVFRKRHAFVLLLFCLFGTGCSFHSNQLNALKTIFPGRFGPRAAVGVFLGGLTEKVFAVNAGPSIFFANSDGILVHFNGVFVEKIEGVRLNSGAEMDISITKTKMDASEGF